MPVWTLIVVTTVRYAGFAMRIDNDGEGGIHRADGAPGVKRHQRPPIVAAGLFGAALIYGDGAITLAISVLPALEGPTSSSRRRADVKARIFIGLISHKITKYIHHITFKEQ